MGTCSRSSRALLWALAALFACGYDGDGDTTLVVDVRVEPAVQAATAFPAEVLVGFDSSGSGFVVFRVGFVCGPPSAPLVLTAEFPDASAGANPAVEAWIVPLASGAPATCGAVPVPQPVPPPPAGTFGFQTSAEANLVVGCGSGDFWFASVTF